MQKRFIVFSAVLWVFLFCSFSVPEEVFAATGTSDTPKNRQVTGIVKEVDTGTKTITVSKKIKDKTTDTVAVYDQKTKVVDGKEQKTISDIHVGDKVTMKYREADGHNRAKKIVIKNKG